ncbi:MAG: P-II family nitrogen regulator [Clostridia bacterium]|nr:P-II family nitrogen regulator [Oscillospiraceae bacterium]MBR6776386.1 P-II family nitrogen regulator [Clostridia bacterium]
MKDLFLLMTIVRRDDASEYEEFYRGEGVEVVYTTPCNGTAHTKTLNLLGIERTEKSMLLATVTSDTLLTLKRRLTSHMKIDLPDRGVAMAVPLSGVGGSRTLEYFTAGQKVADNTQTEDNNMQSSHELIVAIYEKGYTDLVMNAAREAGAGGGTTINAKGTGAGAEKFFGLTLAVEKEIVFIVSSVEKKKDIMKAIMQKAGVDSKAHALVFSLPVSTTAGFRFADTVEKE